MLLLDELERRVLADRQGLIAAGVSEGLPTMHEERRAFYERLEAEPEASAASKLDPAELELRRALRVA